MHIAVMIMAKRDFFVTNATSDASFSCFFLTPLHFLSFPSRNSEVWFICINVVYNAPSLARCFQEKNRLCDYPMFS